MTDEYSFNQKVKDEHGNDYLVVGKTDDENILHVTPVASNLGGMSYCIKHRIAYSNKDDCMGCRLNVVLEPIKGSVTSCDTPEIQRN